MAVLSRLSFVAAALFAVGVNAESHTIKFKNNCGSGTPQLINGGKVVSSGEDFTYNGVFMGIAYLQTGECLFNGEHCTLLEMTLVNPNPAAPGSGSSTDISLIPNHAFNVPAAFSYFDGCDGQGTQCLTATCNTAFFHPDDTWVQVACEDQNVGLLIEFCPNGVGASGGGNPSSTAPKPPPSSTSVAAPSPTSSKTVVTTVSFSTATSAAAHTTSIADTTTTSIADTTTTSVAAVKTSSTASTDSFTPTTVVSSSIAPSSTFSTSAAQSSSPVNRKQCKPGQKLVRKRDIPAKREPEVMKREALSHHRRAHGHH